MDAPARCSALNGWQADSAEAKWTVTLTAPSDSTLVGSLGPCNAAGRPCTSRSVDSLRPPTAPTTAVARLLGHGCSDESTLFGRSQEHARRMVALQAAEGERSAASWPRQMEAIGVGRSLPPNRSGNARRVVTDEPLFLLHQKAGRGPQAGCRPCSVDLQRVH